MLPTMGFMGSPCEPVSLPGRSWVQRMPRPVGGRGRLANRADALHETRWAVEETVFVGDDTQPIGGAKQLAGLKKKVRPGRLAHAFVALRKGLVKQHATGRHGG